MPSVVRLQKLEDLAKRRTLFTRNAVAKPTSAKAKITAAKTGFRHAILHRLHRGARRSGAANSSRHRWLPQPTYLTDAAGGVDNFAFTANTSPRCSAINQILAVSAPDGFASFRSGAWPGDARHPQVVRRKRHFMATIGDEAAASQARPRDTAAHRRGWRRSTTPTPACH